VHHRILQTKNFFCLNTELESGQAIENLYRHSNVLGVLGWIMENGLYQRHGADMTLESGLNLFNSGSGLADLDKLYLNLQPLRPLSDKNFELNPLVEKILVLLVYPPSKKRSHISSAEILVSNTWGELFFYENKLVSQASRQGMVQESAAWLARFGNHNTRLYIYQYSLDPDPDIVHELKKAYSRILLEYQDGLDRHQKPYLDKL
jgi:adenylate cyclase class 1